MKLKDVITIIAVIWSFVLVSIMADSGMFYLLAFFIPFMVCRKGISISSFSVTMLFILLITTPLVIVFGVTDAARQLFVPLLSGYVLLTLVNEERGIQ